MLRRGADRRHRDRQVATASRGSPRSACRRSTPISWPATAVAPGSPGLAAVVERFGRGVLRRDGTLDRAALAAIVFADRAARADLEAIVHPDVYRRIREWFANLPPRHAAGDRRHPAAVRDRPRARLRPASSSALRADEQLRRLVDRDGLTEADARARLAAQWPIEEKVKRADYVDPHRRDVRGDRAPQDRLSPLAIAAAGPRRLMTHCRLGTASP